jgi:selenocysteine lyase/cysteine desulfurase
MNVETIARAVLADFLGGGPDEVALGANGTTLTFRLGRARLRNWSVDESIHECLSVKPRPSKI